jgi:replicative superfamily II helicase
VLGVALRSEGHGAAARCAAAQRCCDTACAAAGANVLVAAHTSAGKTVVAEYAFAMGIR